MALIHASCVSIAGRAVLLRGPSGVGKSDLALRLIDQGGHLVSDDQVHLAAEDGHLIASPPATLAGMIEVRGLGIIRLPYFPQAAVVAVLDLAGAGVEIDRMPEAETTLLEGLALPLWRLHPFHASAAAKVRLAVRLAAGDIMAVE